MPEETFVKYVETTLRRYGKNPSRPAVDKDGGLDFTEDYLSYLYFARGVNFDKGLCRLLLDEEKGVALRASIRRLGAAYVILLAHRNINASNE